MRCLQTNLNIKLIALSLTSALLAPLAIIADEIAPFPIAGVNPHQRPANAPVIKQVLKNDEWYKNALDGVDTPYPTSLRFLENQGNWYTPFTRKGMTAPYDIRGWHSKNKDF